MWRENLGEYLNSPPLGSNPSSDRARHQKWPRNPVVAFNYRRGSTMGAASRSISSVPGSSLEPQQNRAESGTKTLTFWEIAATLQSGVCTNCLFWPGIVGVCNIQHIPHTANICWTVSEPAKIHPFPGLEAGFHPGCLDNSWKTMREEGKFNFFFTAKSLVFGLYTKLKTEKL